MAFRKLKMSRIIGVAGGLIIIALIILAFLPPPQAVEIGRVEKGPMRVTVDEEGEVRAHDRFVVSSPIAGRMERIELHDGDPVKRGDVVAVIYPTPLDSRQRGELLAHLNSAEALKREADERVDRARVDYNQARRELDRSERLAKAGLISTQSLEQARTAEQASRNEVEANRSRAAAAASDVDAARAALVAIDTESELPRTLKLHAPVTGRVLRVVEKSERVVSTGTPLVIIGNPARMEVVVDLLTTDAVKIRPGMQVLLENWGGEQPLQGRVRLVEAAAFTKVSALGVEEQRVNVVADFVGPSGTLGDGFRVEARIVVWETRSAPKIPASAVFRHAEGWSAFAVESGHAYRRDVKIGHRNALELELLDGLKEGDEVVLHPSNKLKDGARVESLPQNIR